MKNLIAALTATLFAAGAYAQAPAPGAAPAAKPAPAPLVKPAPQKPAVAPAARPNPGADCNAKAVGSDGKPLAGAAKSAFMKKCLTDSGPAPAGKPEVKPEAKPDAAPAASKPNPGADCNAKAVGSNGKPLAGAAKSAFMRKCMADSRPAPAGKPEAKPDAKPESKPMPMKKPAPGPQGRHPSPAQQAQQDKMKACSAQGKGMKGPEHQKFMKECLSKK